MSNFDDKEQCDSCGGDFDERSMVFNTGLDKALCHWCYNEIEEEETKNI